MNDKTIHNSSDNIWNEMIAGLKACADTPAELDVAEAIGNSGEVTADDIVDFFDDSGDGVVNAFDNKAWVSRSFLTKYVDSDFEDKIIEQYYQVIQTGVAVDKMKLLEKICFLPQDEELSLLVFAASSASELVVFKKALYRLQDLHAEEALPEIIKKKISVENESREIIAEADRYSIQMQINAIRSDAFELSHKEYSLKVLENFYLPEVEDLLIEIIQGSYELSLQILAVEYLSKRKTQRSFDVLKAEVLHKNDYLYQLGDLVGIDEIGKFAVNKDQDKQSEVYQSAVHEAFSQHRLYDATRDVRDLLAQGHTDFRSFDMSGADLSGLDFKGCDLDKADLSGCDLTHANLGVAKNLRNIMLNKARFGDVVWQGAIGHVWSIIENGATGKQKDWDAVEADLENLEVLQVHTHYFSLDNIRFMLNGASDGIYELGLKLLGKEVEIEHLPILLDALKRDIDWYYSAKPITEQLKIIREKSGSPVVYDLCPYLFDEASPKTRENAAYVIGEMFGSEAVGPLMKAVQNKNEDHHTMIMITRSLAKIHLKYNCVPVDELMQILTNENSSDSQIQGVAIFMQEIHHTKAASALWALAQRADTLGVNTSIYEALATLYNDSKCISIQQMIEMSKSDKEPVLKVLLGFMENITLSAEDGTKIAPYLLDLYDGDNLQSTYEVQACVRVLCQIHEAGGEVSAEKVMLLFNQVHGHYSYYIAPLIGTMGLVDAVPDLLRALESCGLREHAVNFRAALVEIHKKHGAVPVQKVIDILSSEKSAAREGAADFLKEFKVKEAVPDLMNVLHRPLDNTNGLYDKVAARQALKVIDEECGCVEGLEIY